MKMNRIRAWSPGYDLEVRVASRDTVGRSFDWPMLATRAVVEVNRWTTITRIAALARIGSHSCAAMEIAGWTAQSQADQPTYEAAMYKATKHSPSFQIATSLTLSNSHSLHKRHSRRRYHQR